jgi:hypothetical protein
VDRLRHRNAAIAGAACVAMATADVRPDAWLEYAQRIQVAQVEKFYSNQHSLKTVFLQLVGPGEGGISSGLFPPSHQAVAPRRRHQGLCAGLPARAPGVHRRRHRAALRRADRTSRRFTLGPLLVFTWLTVNMYYWNMLGLLALGLASRAGKHFFLMLLTIFASYITYYTYQHLNRGFAEGYLLATLLAGLIVGTSLWELRDAKRATA